MPLFEQTFLKPAKYYTGNGRFTTIDAEFIKNHVAGTARLLADGHRVPILFEHAESGSDEGAPVQAQRDKLADTVKHAAGWLVDVKAKDGGNEAVHVLEVPDENIAKKLRSGEIRYTSPEFRPTWIDGKGRVYQNIISHVALTHKPRSTDQSAFVEPTAAATGDAGKNAAVLQFSLADMVEQMAETETKPADEKRTLLRALLNAVCYIPADVEISENEIDADELLAVLTKLDAIKKRVDAAAKAAQPTIAMSAGEGDESAKPDGGEDKPGEGKPPAKPAENKDMPDGTDTAGKQMEALLANLKSIGLDLPADTTPETLVPYLLTAVKTFQAATAKAKGGEPDGDESAAPVEGRGPQQFSLAAVTADDFANKLLGKVIRQQHAQTKAKFDALVSANQITPALRDSILKPAKSLLFSADGDELPSFTAEQLADMLAVLPRGTQLGVQLSAAVEGTHPNGDAFYSETPTPIVTGAGIPEPQWNMTPAQAKALNDKLDAARR